MKKRVMKKKDARERRMKRQELEQMMRCPDCGVRLGRRHLLNCDQETCPICGRQAISCTCHCYDPQGKPKKGFLRKRRAYIGISELNVGDYSKLISHIRPLWAGGAHVPSNLHYVWSSTMSERVFGFSDHDLLTEEELAEERKETR